MKTKVIFAGLAATTLAAWVSACSNGGAKEDAARSVPVTDIPGHETLGQDTSPKEEPRLVPQEAYMRTYLALFGGLAPVDVQTEARAGGTGLFDTWNDYLASMGFPDYRIDLPRSSQTNALMLATFERLGIALCDKAVERDLMGTRPIEQRVVFAFDPPATVDAESFKAPFDLLHRTFLGYPAALAPTDRTARFYALYTSTTAAHADPKAPKSLFKPAQAGWAAVCYGLVRHPEFHLY
jgi:hypothetical protein